MKSEEAYSSNIFLDSLQRATQKAFKLHQNGQLPTPDALAFYVAEQVHFECSGMVIYVPKNQVLIQKRDKQICLEFTGNNAGELAKKYGLSLAWIYKIVKRGKK